MSAAEQAQENQVPEDDLDSQWAQIVANDTGDAEPAKDLAEPDQPEAKESPDQPEPQAQQPAEVAAAQPEEDVATLRRKLEAAEHAAKSERGRQAALQKQLADYRKALQENQKPAAPAMSEEEARELAELKENYPELAAVLDKRFGSIEKAVNQRLNATIEPLQAALNEQTEAQQRAAIKESMSLVESKHPDWSSLIQTQEFGAWVGTQPQFFVDVLQNSFNPSDINWVFDRYKEARNQAAKSIQAQKQTKLAAAAGIPAKSLPVDTKAGSEDEDAIWQQMIREEQKALGTSRRR